MKRNFWVLLLGTLLVAVGCGPGEVHKAAPPSLSITGQTRGEVALRAKKGQALERSLHAVARHHYTVCLAPATGDADLYSTFFGESQASKNRGLWQEEGKSIPKRDCLTFEAEKSGVIALRVVAVTDFRGTLYFVGHPYDNVPAGFENALIPPLDKLALTHRKYGPVGSPWGNEIYEPFADHAHDGFLHSGTDLAARVCTPVKAVCDGIIVRKGMLDDPDPLHPEKPSEWGGYIILECGKGNVTLSIGYDHLFPPNDNTKGVDRPLIPAETLQHHCHIPDIKLNVGDEVKQGSVVGYVYKMGAEGELDHLHFTIAQCAYEQCAKKKEENGYKIYYSPQRGSIYWKYFPGKWIESDPEKNFQLFN